MDNCNAIYIENSIKNLINDFRMYPNKYLTEEDVRIHLCFNLIEHFGEIKNTNDSDKSIPLHTEVRWYGRNKSKERSDIVIFDVSDLSVTENKVYEQEKISLIPQKGYSFNKAIAIIELKLRRFGHCSDRSYCNSVKKDINKLSNIKKMFMDDEISSPEIWLVALDKKSFIRELAEYSEDIEFNFKYAYKEACTKVDTI